MPKKSAPIISVVVATYNRARLLANCLEHLYDQSLKKSSYEVIVGDNASKDETPAVVEEFQNRDWSLRYFYEKKQGLSYVRNTGFRLANADWVAYIDDDSIPKDDWLQKLSLIIGTQKKAVIIGGQTFPIYEIEPPVWLKDLDLYTRSQGSRKRYLKSNNAPHVINGSNMTIKKSCLEEVGGFNINLGLKGKKLRFGEDPECCMRIYKIHPFIYYDPDIIVYDFIPEECLNLLYTIRRRFATARDGAYFYDTLLGYSSIMKNIFRLVLSFRAILKLLLMDKGDWKAEQTKLVSDYFWEWGHAMGLLKKRFLYTFGKSPV